MNQAAVRPFRPDLSQFLRPVKACASLGDFFKHFELNDFAYSIQLERTVLDLEIYIRDPRVVVFFLNGAKNPDTVKTLPCFTGRSISSNVKASCVFISDPTFYLNEALTLGWYGGSTHDRLQSILPDVFSFIAKHLGAQKVMFFGGSGGGFASLYYGRHLPGSLSVIWNPQTVLTNYYPGAVKQYARTAFDCESKNLQEHIVTDLPAFYRDRPGDNTVIYLQSMTDAHVKKHLTPFLNARSIDCPVQNFSGWVDPSLYLHLSDWSEGHTPPPRKALFYLVNTLSDPDADWSQEGIAQTIRTAADVGAS